MGAQAIDKNLLKSVPLDMEEIRRRYGLRREMFAPLQELFKDAPPASEMVKLLRK